MRADVELQVLGLSNIWYRPLQEPLQQPEGDVELCN